MPLRLRLRLRAAGLLAVLHAAAPQQEQATCADIYNDACGSVGMVACGDGCRPVAAEWCRTMYNHECGSVGMAVAPCGEGCMPAGTMPPPEPEPEPEPEADPPPPPPPPPAEPDDADPPGLLRAEVTVAVDLAAIAEGTAERAAFEADFARDVAALLGVDAARVVIESIVSGSVVVTFAVLPGADGSGLPPSALEDAFAGGGVQLAGFAATGLLVEEDWNARMLDMLAVEIRDCDVCTPREEFAYTLLASGLGLLGVLGLLVFYCSCRGGPTTPGDCIEVIKCDCDYWDEIEKPFMPVFTGFQCAAYTTLCIWHWQLCLAEGQTVEGAFFVSLFILACFFLFLNVCCCICVRNNIEARLRTCCNFLFNLALNGAVGLAAVIGVSVTVLPEQPGQLLGSCSTMYDCSFADSGSGSYVDAETYGGGNESGSGSWDEGCPGGDESLFAQAFTIGALATSLGVTVGNVAFGYVLTLWGTKARAVILTLNSLVTANFAGEVVLAGVTMAEVGFSPDVLNSVVKASSTAAAMAAAALKLEKASYVLQGAAMGKTAIEPVLAIVERPLRDDVAMCTGIGEPTKEYPNGEWLDCDPQLQMGATWAYASVNMAAVGGAMGLGTTKPKLVGALACSMMGADMCVASLSALVETIAPDAAQTLEINRVPITYFLCFCGWRTQYILRPEPEQPPGEAAADGAKKEGAEGEGAAAEEAREPEEAEDAAGDKDGDKEEGEDDGKGKGKKKKKKKKPLGPKVMKLCSKKLPGLDKVLIRQYDFLDKSKPAKILLGFDLMIKNLVGSLPEGAPKPDPKQMAKDYLTKLKMKVKKLKKTKVSPGDLTDPVANAPDLSEGKAGKLPPIDKPEP